VVVYKVFLDVENLTNVANLEAIVDNSEVVLMFLSAGYFSRWNCLREVRQALVAQKEIITMREVAVMHGGGPLHRILREFNEKSIQSMYSAFDAEHTRPGTADIKQAIIDTFAGDTILWHRVPQFKQLSLKIIASRVLQQQQQADNGLVIPGELRLEDVKIPMHEGHHICLSKHQPESAAVRESFLKHTRAAPSRRQSLSERMTQRITSHDLAQPVDATALLQKLRIGLLGEEGCTLHTSSNFVLLLSVDALHCEELMDEVRAALLHGVNIITLHDKDPSGNTEEFDSFIAACPADLCEGDIMHNGQRIQVPRLFDRLAVDWLGHSYRKLSVALALRALKSRHRSSGSAEEVAKGQAVKVGNLSLALEEATGGDAQMQAISAIEFGDI
jgi:hypothetical protein